MDILSRMSLLCVEGYTSASANNLSMSWFVCRMSSYLSYDVTTRTIILININLLHEVDDAVAWQESTATTALTK